jgi:hypothetical protein
MKKSLKLTIIYKLLKIREELKKETLENKQMLEFYYKASFNQASKEELEKANYQFNQLIKTIGLGVILTIPFSIITFPMILKLAKMLKIDILPKWFQDSHNK